MAHLCRTVRWMMNAETSMSCEGAAGCDHGTPRYVWVSIAPRCTHVLHPKPKKTEPNFSLWCGVWQSKGKIPLRIEWAPDEAVGDVGDRNHA